jgi:hypothetical protein
MSKRSSDENLEGQSQKKTMNKKILEYLDGIDQQDQQKNDEVGLFQDLCMSQ